MKATIGGVTIEGTPEEINRYMELRESKGFVKDYFQKTTGKCPNQGSPCNCTGACMGKGATNSIWYLTQARGE